MDFRELMRELGELRMSGEGGSGDGRLSTRLSHLESEVASVVVKVDSLEENVRRIAKGVEVLGERFVDRTKPQWGVMASWASVLIALGALYTSMALNPVKEKQDWIFAGLQEHIATEGHLGMVKELKFVNEKVRNLDTVLQREMRLLDATSEEKISVMEQRFREELLRLEKRMDRGRVQ